MGDVGFGDASAVPIRRVRELGLGLRSGCGGCGCDDDCGGGDCETDVLDEALSSTRRDDCIWHTAELVDGFWRRATESRVDGMASTADTRFKNNFEPPAAGTFYDTRL